MVSRENFHADLAGAMFDATVKIDPYKGEVYVANFRTTPIYRDNEYTYDQVIEYMKKRVVIDTNNLCSVTLDQLIKLMEKKIGRKRYRFSATIKPQIAKKYDLFLAPDYENKVIFGVIKPCTVYENIITFMNKRTAENFNVSDILYVGYGNHCVEIHTKNDQNNMFNVSFSDVAEVLTEHDCFVRSYKNCLVNMDNVVGIEEDTFKLNNGEYLSIPKRRLKEITNIYNEYKMVHM